MTTPLMIQQTMPGSHGEHELQEEYGTRSRAEAFYKHQVLSYLNPPMRTFIARQEMFFLSTADGHGECDVSFRAGEAGFVHVLDERILVYPEYRGNGVLASLGNIAENPQTPMKYNVHGIPTLMLFKNGQVAATKIGALPKSKLVEWVESVL